MSSPFASPDYYGNICRGCFYWAIAPFQPQDPVQVFHPHTLDTKVGIAAPDPSVFDSGLERPVIVQYKKRPVFVVQNDKVNHSKSHHYTIVALSYSFEDKPVTPAWYDDVVAWKIPYAAYIPPNVLNRKDGYVDLGNLLLMHKSMLLQRITDECPFTSRQQMAITARMKEQLGLDIIPGPTKPAAGLGSTPSTPK